MARSTRLIWAAIAFVVSVVLFFLATSDVVYEVTSPPEFSLHVVLRKAYSVVAFALVGFTVDTALGPSTRSALRGALIVALYSGLIEVAQARGGSHEGLRWNAVDVLCGALGGWLGVVIPRWIARARAQRAG